MAVTHLAPPSAMTAAAGVLDAGCGDQRGSAGRQEGIVRIDAGLPRLHEGHVLPAHDLVVRGPDALHVHFGVVVQVESDATEARVALVSRLQRVVLVHLRQVEAGQRLAVATAIEPAEAIEGHLAELLSRAIEHQAIERVVGSRVELDRGAEVRRHHVRRREQRGAGRAGIGDVTPVLEVRALCSVASTPSIISSWLWLHEPMTCSRLSMNEWPTAMPYSLLPPSLRKVSPAWALSSTPSNLVSRMKLVTPATASVP